MYKEKYFIGGSYHKPKTYNPFTTHNFLKEGNLKLLESQLETIDFEKASDNAETKGVVKNVRKSYIKWIPHT